MLEGRPNLNIPIKSIISALRQHQGDSGKQTSPHGRGQSMLVADTALSNENKEE